MDESRFIQMRKQVEENNQDIRDFLSDMERWRSDVQRKNEKLRAESNKLCDNLPQVRGSLHKKKKKPVSLKQPHGKSETTTPHRIKSSDYKAWDSYDVDKALEAIDKSESEKSPNEGETDEEWEDERRVKLADDEKENGNIRFREGKYEMAVEHYTTAIRLTPGNPLLYSNRALALCKLERFASAEADCSTALTINPKFVKALYRRAHCRRSIGKLDEAISDLKGVLDIEPKNSAALKDLSSWTGELNLLPGSVNSVFKLIDISKVKSVDLRRIPISEFAESTRTKPQGDICERLRLNTYLSSSNEEAGSNDRGTNSNHSLQPSASSKRPPEPPTNWFQMERELRELIPPSQHLTPLAVDYLCSIEPTNYATIIGNNLNSSCLSRFLVAIGSTSILNAPQKAERMEALARLPRFDVAWLLLDDADREVVAEIFQEVPPHTVSSLKALFV